MLRAVEACRVCGGGLVDLFSLGEQALTGLFPRERAAPLPTAPLSLVRCADPGRCGLVQLRHTYDLRALYGPHYGYRSSLNASMVRHLRRRVATILERVAPRRGDLVLDIGSNDATLLRSWPAELGLDRVGIDPIGLADCYPPEIPLIPEFFSARAFRARFGGRRARVVTSIAMFYDLEAPLEFARDVADILAHDGVWVFEQSYLPSMLERTAYDTICHEHLEYYGVAQIVWILERAGLKLLDVELNDVNGGSFAVTAARRDAPLRADTAGIAALLAAERRQLDGLAPFHAFAGRVRDRRDALRAHLESARARGDLVLGYGASTKGNVVLQHCGLGPRELPAIAEVNPDKFGCFTPGTGIPIIPEEEARALRPRAFVVFPWHFRRGIVERELPFLRSGGRLILPLPELEDIGLAEAERLLR